MLTYNKIQEYNADIEEMYLLYSMMQAYIYNFTNNPEGEGIMQQLYYEFALNPDNKKL